MMRDNKVIKFICIGILLIIISFCIFRLRGKTIERSTYSEDFGEIRVKEIQLNPLSIHGLLGLEEKLYRCEFRKSPGGILESAISLQEDSYEAQKIEIFWNSVQKATISFDQAIFYEVKDGIWRKVSNRMIENNSTH